MCRGVGELNTGAFVGEHVNGGEQFGQTGWTMTLQERGGDRKCTELTDDMGSLWTSVLVKG